MKTQLECPHCQSKKVNTGSKIPQIIFGIVMAAIGAGFFVVAFTGVVGYYLFALPLFTIGTISTCKGYYGTQGHAECTKCHTEFEYLLDN